MKNNRLIYLSLSAAVLCQTLPMVFAQSTEHSPTAVVEDAFCPLQPGCVKMKGFPGDKIDTCIRNRIAAQNIEELIEPFQKRSELKLWRCEFWGKWFTSAAAAYQYLQDRHLGAIVDKAVAELLATQTSNGYIGTYQDHAHLQGWDVWGRKYVLLGLLAYYDITSDENTLSAAVRHADFLLSEIGPGKADIVKLGFWNGMAASSILEPVMLLYRKTGQKRYLDFARYIVGQWSSPNGPQLVEKALADIPVYKMFGGSHNLSEQPRYPKDYMSYGQSKAYEMMSCFNGLAQLYRFNDDKRYDKALKNIWENIRQNEITIVGSGSDMERWFGGRYRQTQAVRDWMETCVTVTWMQLCYQMLCLTGQPRFADEIEISVYNALLGAMKQDGTWWSHYSPLSGVRGPAPKQCDMNQNCCVANSPRGMLLLPKVAVMCDGRGPVVNLYFEGSARILLPTATSVELVMKTDYPRGDTITITVRPDRSESFPVSLRIPAWSQQNLLKINGQPWPTQPAAGTYFKIRRQWKDADVIELKLDTRGRIYSAPNNRNYLAVMRGPIVMAVDKRLSAFPTDTELVLKKDDTGYIKLDKASVEKNLDIRMTFTVPCLDRKTGNTVNLLLCDYASAGNAWSDNSRFCVWLPQPFDAEVLKPRL